MASVEQLGKFPEGKILLISPVASVSEIFPVSFNDYIIQTVTLAKLIFMQYAGTSFGNFSPHTHYTTNSTLQHIMLIARVHGSMTLCVAKGFMY